VFVITTLLAAYYVAGAADAWWTVPQDWPANFTPIKHDPITATVRKVGPNKAYTSIDLERRKSEAARHANWGYSDPMVFALELPDKRVLEVLAFDDDAAFAGAREWWRVQQVEHSRTTAFNQSGSPDSITTRRCL
jgi:hypothetical protein